MPQPRARPHLWSIPAGVPFLEALAEAVRRDSFGLGLGSPADDPASLADLTVYLPTRRAVRSFASVLQAQSPHAAMILPRLVPLGDPGEALVADVLHDDAPDAGDDLWPIAPLTRRMLLARLVHAAGKGRAGAMGLSADTLGSAFALGADLAAILDAMQAENTPFDRLKTLDASAFDAFWQTTAELMALLGQHWPAILAERSVCDPIAWRNRVLERQAAAIAAAPTPQPIIVAGSTGSMPATAGLMAAVARAPRGVVVLPDLDLESPDADWQALEGLATAEPDRFASHPQAQLARLLQRLQAARADVQTLGVPAGPLAMRRALVREALRPAQTTDAWADLSARLPAEQIAAGLDGITLIEAPDERIEALAIAVRVRQLLDDAAATIAVITPDRGVAERVTLELRRWDIAVDDSAGQPLARTPAGHLALMLADLAANGVSAAALLDLARHERARFGFAAGDLARAVTALEIGALRGRAPLSGLDELGTAVAAMGARISDRFAPPPLKRLGSGDIAAAARLAGALTLTLAPLLSPGALPLATRLGHLIRALEQASEAGEDGPFIYAGPDGEALQGLLDELMAAAEAAGEPGDPFDLLLILRAAMAEVPVRRTDRQHPRLMVLGALEARLLQADHVILAGLNEGSWPPQNRADPFLNRAMRAGLGLSSPERRIGQSAHDFVQAFLSRRVTVSRALKAGGQPTLPSRFWQRLKAVTPPQTWKDALAGGAQTLAFAQALDEPPTVRACARPRPMPPAALQPLRYSVTEVGTLYRDPYAIFAARILDLKPLPALDTELGARDRGALLHAVIEHFTHRYPRALPPDPEAVLLDLGREAFQPMMQEPDVEAFWWPRFVALVPALAAFERERRARAGLVAAEMRVAQTFPLADGALLTLSARADRVERLADGQLALIDFKGGAVPSHPVIKLGLEPQLVLEAALAARAAFQALEAHAPIPELGPAPVASAHYVRLKIEDGALKPVDCFANLPLAPTADEHLAQFLRVVQEFRSGVRPFISRFAPQSSRRHGDYDHLARVKEWSADGGEGEGEEA